MNDTELGSDVQETREKAGQKENAHGRNVGNVPRAWITGGSTSRNFLDCRRRIAYCSAIIPRIRAWEKKMETKSGQ